MRDGPLRIAVKFVVRMILTAEMGVRRIPLQRKSKWKLGGNCGGCAKCCEAPTLRTGVFVARFPTLRKLFTAWQRVVNGWELVHVDRPSRLFIFSCTHFDPETRKCDSYGSRPLACRDYPRALLQQPWPELFDGCGFRAVASDGDARLRELRATGLSPAQIEDVARRLRLK